MLPRVAFFAFLLPAAFAANPTSSPAPALGWVTQILGSGTNQVTAAATDIQGNLYVTGSTSSADFPATRTFGSAAGTSAFVLKLDPNGQIVYAARAGGTGVVAAAGIAVTGDGGVYVGGTATTADFPVTNHAYQTSPPAASAITGQTAGGTFLFRLNPDGSLAWSTWFGDANTFLTSIAAGSDGSPFIGGFTYGDLPVTQGAYQGQLQGTNDCTGGSIGHCEGPPTNGFLTKFSPDGASLVYSTYIGTQRGNVSALAIDPLGNAYLTDSDSASLSVMNSSGSALRFSAKALSYFVKAMALDPEGNLYLTGVAGSNFQATAGAFATSPQPPIPQLPGYFGPGPSLGEAFVAKLDGTLSHVLAATFLGGEGDDAGQSVAFDSSGNVIIGGQTRSKAFPTRAPFQGSFAVQTGFVAELDNGLSHLIFSTYAGDSRPFSVSGAFATPDGGIVLAGSTEVPVPGAIPPVFSPGNAIIANRVDLPPSPPLRLDSVVNMASKYAVALCPDEAIEARGEGFGADAQILVDGVPLTTVSRSPASVVSLLPGNLKTSGEMKVEVSAGGAVSNGVLMPASVAAPGIYSIHGNGFGQGYIRNSDGSFNSPNRPAKPGDAITIFATGVGALDLESGYVVTPLPISIFVGGFYANGVRSAFARAGRLPGKAYQITVTIPTAAAIEANNPAISNFTYPPQVAVTMILGTILVQGGYSPAPDAAVSQPGLALYIKN
jgi:uncharacterized protein (TIGR03437 family)